MIEEMAVVMRTDSGRVWIKPVMSGSCGGCQSQASCSTATLAKWLPKREFAIDCHLTLQPGDRVIVAIADEGLLLTSLLVYGMPLLFMLFAVLGFKQLLPSASYWLPEIAIAALLLSFKLIHRYQWQWLRKSQYKPHIVSTC